MKRFTLCLVLLGSLAVPSFAAHRPRIFFSSAEVAEDAAVRLARPVGKATPPSGSNTVTYEGNAAQAQTSSNGYGLVYMDANFHYRFECDYNAVSLGCAAVNSGDHLIIYGHLRTYFSCRHDDVDDEVVVNLIYRRSYHQCGDTTCEVWTLLTQ